MTILSLFLTIQLALPAFPAAAEAPSELSRREKAIHVLNRIGYGPRPGDIERVLEMGIDAYLREQLHPETIDDSRLGDRLKDFPTLRMSSGQLVEAYPPPQLVRRQQMERSGAGRRGRPNPSGPRGEMDDETRRMLKGAQKRQREIYAELAQARLIRAVHSSRQLNEVMVDFWMNHFNVFMFKGLGRQLVTEYEEKTVRPLVLGRFEDLLKATARSPAMLYYLDNWISSAPENVVRSRALRQDPLMARVIDGRGRQGRGRSRTGFSDRRRWRSMDRSQRRSWREKARSQGFVLRRAKGLNENYARELLELHTIGVDAGYTQEDVVQVARILTGWSITGPSDGLLFHYNPLLHVEGEKTFMGRTIPSGGVKEGADLLAYLANHPATARFISSKLVRRFVADDPPPSLVDRAAERFLATGGDIREVLNVILTSPEFFSPEHHRAKIKKPLELVAGAIRALDGELGESRPLLRALRELGEPLYACRPPTGYPDVAKAWINTNSLLQRLNLAIALSAGRVRGVGIDLETAQPLLQEMGLPQPSADQLESTRSAVGEAGPEWAPKKAGADHNSVLATAFMLGSPQFQKR